MPEGTRLLVLGPAGQGPQDRGRSDLRGARKQGFVRVRVDGETLRPRRGADARQVQAPHDRGRGRPDVVRRAEAPTNGHATSAAGRSTRRRAAVPDPIGRLADSVETALRLGEGVVLIAPVRGRASRRTSRRASFPRALLLPVSTAHDRRARAAQLLVQLAARRLPDCTGLGVRLEIDPDLRHPGRGKSVARQGAVVPWARLPSPTPAGA